MRLLPLLFVLLASAMAVPLQGKFDGETALLSTQEVPTMQDLDGIISAEEDPFSPGTGRAFDTPNFPGAPYGLPGYKESHDWVNDVDLTSPVVFDWGFFAAAEHPGATKTEEEMKTEWTTYLATSASYPNCKLGSLDWNANTYYEANTGEFGEEQEYAGTGCGNIVKQYLAKGMFDGMSTQLPFPHSPSSTIRFMNPASPTSTQWNKCENDHRARNSCQENGTPWVPASKYTFSFMTRFDETATYKFNTNSKANMFMQGRVSNAGNWRSYEGFRVFYQKGWIGAYFDPESGGSIMKCDKSVSGFPAHSSTFSSLSPAQYAAYNNNKEHMYHWAFTVENSDSSNSATVKFYEDGELYFTCNVNKRLRVRTGCSANPTSAECRLWVTMASGTISEVKEWSNLVLTSEELTHDMCESRRVLGYDGPKDGVTCPA
jgi:hypothetical protein